MPCRSDYLSATDAEIEASKVLALLEELNTGELPDYYGDGYYSEVYNKNSVKILEENVPKLCRILQKSNVEAYSLEMQMWWRDHQKADKERVESELKNIKEEKDREAALSKLTDYEKRLLGF